MAKTFSKTRINELLSKYFEIEGDTATIDLYYDSFEDIINQNFGKDNVNMLDSRLFDDLESAFDLIPRKYKINLRLNLRDLGQFSINQIKEIVESNLALKGYSLGLRNIRKTRINLIVMGIGAAILIASYALSRIGTRTIFYDVVNIAGTLFIWEATSSLFIENNYEKLAISRLAAKMQRITVYGPNGEVTECEAILKHGRKK